ncbi:glycosyltransferase family 2 protein [Mangrovibacterium marinum]|uniref:Glycosyltransferase 2-like domain-containing protein n=1 Tax=Mangrovibacterium marinum TaxID=1639118 RepID=A0A2T5C5L6_9BACT|nr:glycosyltransferase family 2 protein [Mangrovibacterium marinum]PTN10172.1 hypothetical protein C8N47_102157 [Mangrovibacterium marinum]
MLDISVIIINFNTAEYTKSCIESLLKNTSKALAFHIVVVDNASDLDDYHLLSNYVDSLSDPRITVVRSKINTGFGGGHMIGVQNAQPSKYLAFINNDTVLVQDSLHSCFKFMERTVQAGVCAPIIVNEERKPVSSFDHYTSISRELLGRYVLEFLFPKKYPPNKGVFELPTIVDCVKGSFMFVRADAFYQVGGFDTNIFLYYEESDLCKRISAAKGYKTYLLPETSYVHYEGGSTQKSIDIKIERRISLLYVIRKHNGFLFYIALKYLLIFRYFVVSIVKPRYWKLLACLLVGAPLSHSLKQKQIIG